MITTKHPSTATVSVIPLTHIRMEEPSQTRVKVQRSVVRAYAEAMKRQQEEGQLQFPPIVLFCDDTAYWLADGFHRVLAAREIGLTEFPVEIRSGGERDALLFAISANSAHGLPRNRADRKKAVCLLLADPEWSQWSDREIARRCQVDHHYVGRLRRLSGESPQMRARKARRRNTVYEMSARSQASQTAQRPGNGESETPNVSAAAAADPAGVPLSEEIKPVFACLAQFRSARALYGQLAEVIDRIARSPGGELLRETLKRPTDAGTDRLACAELDLALEKLLAAEPYLSCCPYCLLAHAGWNDPDCKACRGRGWITRAALEACPENYRKEIDRLRRV